MKKYIIYAPKYSKSNGVRCLYKLRDLLEAKGYEAYIYAIMSNEINTKYCDNITRSMKKNDIIVYPEIICGNPMGFANVARWVIYFPGVLGGDDSYDSREAVFTFDKKYLSDAPELFIDTMDASLFYKDDTPKTKNCYFVYKGGKWKDILELNGFIEINRQFPKKRENLAKLLRETKILYSYDRYTLLLDEAKMCGCEVRIITEDGFETYNPPEYTKTVPPEIGLDNFINITQKMSNPEIIEELDISLYMKKIFYSLRIFMSKYFCLIEKKLKKVKEIFIKIGK